MTVVNSVGDRESYGMNVKLSISLPFNVYTGIALAAISNPADLCMFVEDDLTVVPGQSAGYMGNMSRGGTELGYANVWYASQAAGGYTPIVDDPYSGTFPNNTDYATPFARHTGGANVAYTDGHVKWVTYNALYIPPAGTTPANFRLWHPDAQ